MKPDFWKVLLGQFDDHVVCVTEKKSKTSVSRETFMSHRIFIEQGPTGSTRQYVESVQSTRGVNLEADLSQAV